MARIEDAGLAAWEMPVQAEGVALSAQISSPPDASAWVVIGRVNMGAPPPVVRTITEELHELGVGTMTMPLPQRDVRAMAGWISLATAHLRAEVAPQVPVAYLGASRHAAGGWLASLGGGLDGVIAWNCRPGGVWRQLPGVAVPSLLVVDSAIGPRQRVIAAVARRRLGGPAEVARCVHHEDVAALIAWYERLLDPSGFVALRPRRLTVKRAATVVAATGVAAVPGLALPDFSAGQKLSSASSGATAPAAQPYKPGDKPHTRGVLGDPPLTDGIGLRWNINTNVGFATTSSASGAVSEAGFTHAVAASTLNGGTVNAVLADTFDGYNALCIDVNNVGGQCNTANMAVYNQNGPSSLECSGRQVVLPLRTIGNFQVSRKVFVPTNDGFARWLNIITNTSATPQTVRLVASNNLGSDAATRIVTTSDGDLTPELSDTWVTTFQNFSGMTSSDPRLGHVLRGPNGGVGLAAINFANGDDNPFWRYVFTLRPGQTANIMNFATGQATRAAAATQAAALANLTNPNALACLTSTEIRRTRNFFPLIQQSLPGVVVGSTSWQLRDTLTTGAATLGPFTYGTKPLVPLMGDWDGDGTDTPGTFEAGVFKLRNANSAGPPDPIPFTFTHGDPRGFPVSGDFNGDSTDDVAVFRAGLWQIRLSTGVALAPFSFGSGSWPATIPVAGDWNGDGTDGIGFYALNSATWNLRNSPNAGAVDIVPFVFGTGSASYPVAGDWNADGTDSIGVKATAGSTWSLRNTNGPGAAEISFDFGALPASQNLPVVWGLL